VCRIQRSGIAVEDLTVSDLPPNEARHSVLHEQTIEGKLDALHELAAALPAGSAAVKKTRAELLELIAEIRHDEEQAHKAVVAKALSAFKQAGSRQRSKKGAEFLLSMGLHRDGSAAGRIGANTDANSLLKRGR